MGMFEWQAALRSLLEGTSDVAILAQWPFQDFVLRQGLFRGSDFKYLGPDGSVPGTQHPDHGIFTQRVARPGSYLSSMPRESDPPGWL
jgi:hypothetical protein